MGSLGERRHFEVTDSPPGNPASIALRAVPQSPAGARRQLRHLAVLSDRPNTPSMRTTLGLAMHQVAQAGGTGGTDRSSALARRWCRSSSAAIGRSAVLVAKQVSRSPSASVIRNWAPGSGVPSARSAASRSAGRSARHRRSRRPGRRHGCRRSRPDLRIVSTSSTAPGPARPPLDHRPRRGHAGTTRYPSSPGKCLRQGRERGPRRSSFSLVRGTFYCPDHQLDSPLRDREARAPRRRPPQPGGRTRRNRGADGPARPRRCRSARR